MWYLKFKVKHKDCIYSPLVEKFNLSILFYPQGYFVKKNKLFVSAVQTISGESKNVKKYINSLRKNRRVVKMEVFGNLIFTLAKQKLDREGYMVVYNPALFYPAPAYYSKDGFEVWEIASWNRTDLQDIVNVFKKKTKKFEQFNVLQFTRKDLTDLFVIQLLPKLTNKQKQALELAYSEGYYVFPKKTDLNKLAKLMRISKQTFQEHLKKAEAKLMPILLRK